MNPDTLSSLMLGILIGLSPGLFLVPWVLGRKRRHDFETWFQREAL